MTDLKMIRTIDSEEVLDDCLSVPRPELIEMMKELRGDIMILGVAGKMGVTLARMAKRAIDASGKNRKVYGVARFSDPMAKARLERWGIETIVCDLLDQSAVQQLPEVANVIYMAGRKFGTDGLEGLTWAMNTTVPAYVAEHFKGSRIVVFSTGCVYPLVSVASCGCTEDTMAAPVGEYAQSCLGRERIFEYFARKNDTPILLFRLNYAIDLRYGVLFDIASHIWQDQPVSASVGHFNVIWQGDANNYALLSLQLAGKPAVQLNVTGPETVPLANIADTFGNIMNKQVEYCGKPGDISYLNNASKLFSHFGYPEVSLQQMIKWQADWLMKGGRGLGKPTHFEVNDGKY